MASGPTLPPQAYTREILTAAFNWLQSQPESVRKLATSPDALVGLYMRAQRYGSSSFEADAPVSSQNFMSDLKSLAEGLKQFEDPNERKLNTSSRQASMPHPQYSANAHSSLGHGGSMQPQVQFSQPQSPQGRDQQAQMPSSDPIQAAPRAQTMRMPQNPQAAAQLAAQMSQQMSSQMAAAPLQNPNSQNAQMNAQQMNAQIAMELANVTQNGSSYLSMQSPAMQSPAMQSPAMQSPAMQNPAPHTPQNSSNFTPSPQPHYGQSQTAFGANRPENAFGALNGRSLQMIQEVKSALNLSSDEEAVNMMIALAYKNLKNLLA